MTWVCHLVICTDRRAPGYLRAIADEIDAPLVELGIPSARYMAEEGASDPVAAGVVLSKEDNHYTAFGHRLIAEYLAGVLLSNPDLLT